jgi:CheY-like chemotaxis protein
MLPSAVVLEQSDRPVFHALVVEDNIINQTVLRRQLLKAGWQCDGESPANPHAAHIGKLLRN